MWAEVDAGVPDVFGGSIRSLADVPGSSGKSLKVATVVPDVSDGSGRSLEVAAVIPDVPGGS